MGPGGHWGLSAPDSLAWVPMASRSRPSAEKRRIEKQRQENRAAKLERRQSRAAEEGEEAGPSEDELFERFRLLNEGRAAGRVSDEDFEKARAEIMEALGVEG